MRPFGWIFDNFLYKAVALFVSVILWMATQGLSSVEAPLTLQVILEDYDQEDFVVVEQSTQEVNFTISGSQAAVRRAQQQLKTYPISLAGVGAGELRVAVDPKPVERELPRGAEIAQQSYPTNLVFRLEPVERKVVPVRVDYVGEPAPGYRIVGVRAEPQRLALAGARSSIGRVREVVTQRVDVAGAQASRRQDVQVLIGRPNVWRDDPELDAVSVQVVVEAIERAVGDVETPEEPREEGRGGVGVPRSRPGAGAQSGG